MVTLYEAAGRNYREVEKALAQVERSVAAAIRRNDESTVDALTRVQLLVASVKAEARLMKIVYTPRGLTGTERSRVLAEDTALGRWGAAIDAAFARHYRVPKGEPFADALDHDVLAKHSTLHELLTNELDALILLRNKLAHGQWRYPFNAALTGIESTAMRALSAEDSLTIRYRDRLISQLGNIVVDLVSSAAGFESRFNEYFVKIRRYRKALEQADFEQWALRLRATKVAVARIAPASTPAAN